LLLQVPHKRLKTHCSSTHTQKYGIVHCETFYLSLTLNSKLVMLMRT